MQGFGFSAVDPYQNYDNITHNFLGVVKKHTPLKGKFIRGNQTLFMNEKLQRKVDIRSKPRNNFCRELSGANKIAYKKHRNNSLKIRKKRIKTYMIKVLL